MTKSTGGGAKSFADELVEVRDELTEEIEPKLFELPGYGPRLQAKYRILKRAENKEIKGGIVRRAQAGEENADIGGMCSMLSRTCVGFYREVDGEPVLLNEAEKLGEDIIHWGDERLATMFSLEFEGKLRARQVIECVLPKPELIELHHSKVAMWMDVALERVKNDF